MDPKRVFRPEPQFQDVTKDLPQIKPFASNVPRDFMASINFLRGVLFAQVKKSLELAVLALENEYMDREKILNYLKETQQLLNQMPDGSPENINVELTMGPSIRRKDDATV